jgi:hypothetical protein
MSARGDSAATETITLLLMYVAAVLINSSVCKTPHKTTCFDSRRFSITHSIDGTIYTC